MSILISSALESSHEVIKYVSWHTTLILPLYNNFYPEKSLCIFRRLQSINKNLYIVNVVLSNKYGCRCFYMELFDRFLGRSILICTLQRVRFFNFKKLEILKMEFKFCSLVFILFDLFNDHIISFGAYFFFQGLHNNYFTACYEF